MIQKRLAFVFELILKLEKVAIIDQNGKVLAFTFSPFWAIFWTSGKRLKKAWNQVRIRWNWFKNG